MRGYLFLYPSYQSSNHQSLTWMVKSLPAPLPSPAFLPHPWKPTAIRLVRAFEALTWSFYLLRQTLCIACSFLESLAPVQVKSFDCRCERGKSLHLAHYQLLQLRWRKSHFLQRVEFWAELSCASCETSSPSSESPPALQRQSYYEIGHEVYLPSHHSHAPRKLMVAWWAIADSSRLLQPGLLLVYPYVAG